MAQYSDRQGANPQSKRTGLAWVSLTACVVAVIAGANALSAEPTPVPAAQRPSLVAQEVCVNTASRACQCILTRARQHVALPKAEQLSAHIQTVDWSALDIPASALEDAYFTGSLEPQLSKLAANITSVRGKARDAQLETMRQLRREAGRAVAGTCLPDEYFADQRAFHRTGLSKGRTQQIIADAHVAGEVVKVALRSSDSAGFTELRR
ncbi:hypothetical protein ACJ3XI_11915 [Litorimonas sp. RW-G-Af-16]|uniref:hypothetical protein n=1 Tax=Litorimonas sp. RW-G-Af-16 TaxID=3241168 RepID=UPI00390C909E